MLLILLAIIALILICILCLKISPYGNDLIELASSIFICIGFCGLIVYAFLAWGYFAAGYKKDIINREYGTSYTHLEVYYASDVIETIREIDRKRIELNGDIITGE